jgi:hypothetical protein
MLGSRLIYNGVLINQCKTLAFSQESVRDDANNQMFHKHRIEVEGIVTAQSLGANPELGFVGTFGTGAADPVHALALVKLALGQDRKPLWYGISGRTLLEVLPAHIPDADNGPTVEHVDVVHLSPMTFRVHFAVAFANQDCNATTTSVLSNTWACTDNVDDQWRVTRSWRGRIRMRMAVNNPHVFRGLVVPPILTGWRRQSMNFTGEPNGLELTYEIVDVELIGNPPPIPGLKMQFRHSEELSLDLIQSTSTVHVRLDANRDANKQQMIAAAIAIIDSKLDMSETLNTTALLNSLLIVDHGGDSEVAIEVNCSLRRVPKEDSSGPIQSTGGLLDIGSLVTKKLGTPIELPDYGPRAISPSVYPSSLANLFSVYLQTPCGPHEMPKLLPDQAQESPVEEYVFEGPTTSYTPSAPPPEIKKPEYSQDHVQSAYTYAKVESIYKIKERKIQCSDGNGDDVFLTLGKPRGRRIVKLALERIGEPPIVYEATEFTDNEGIRHVPLESDVNARQPLPTANGKLWAIDQTIIFGLSPCPAVSQMRTPYLPWSSAKAAALPSGAATAPDDGEKGI